GGLFSGAQAAMMMYGTGAGVGLSILFLSANLPGAARQLSLYQAGLNAAASLVLAGLFYLEAATQVPLVLALTQRLATTGSLQLALAFVALQTVTVLLALATSRAAPRWLDRLSPATAEQDLSRPQYINEQALADPESALDLVEKEQLRLLERLPAQLDTLRAEAPQAGHIPAGALHAASVALGTQVRSFLRELVEHHADAATTGRILQLEHRQSLLTSLDEAVHGFVHTLDGLRGPGASAIDPLLDRLVESLSTLLLTATDAARSGDPEDMVLLHRLTGDRGDLMERLRHTFSNTSPELDHSRKTQLFYLTSLFERIVWLLRQLAQARAAPGT
ncbi:MAG TPA: hypothetical protein VGE76_24620, partial [Opitutaceae bacterium]